MDTATTSAGENLIGALESRFTCKRYSPEGHIPDSAFTAILEAGRLSPSSFGLEPWKFLVIENKDLLGEILQVSWGAKRNADRTVVILAKRGVTIESDWFRDINGRIKGMAPADIETLAERFDSFQKNDLHLLDSDRSLFDWASKQTYIVLANMLTAAAVMGVDATPVEGYNSDALTGLLADRELLDPQEWGVSVLVQFGIHDPSHRMHPKTRRSLAEVVERID